MEQEHNEKVNRIVNANMMVASLKVLHENMEYFRASYKGTEKNVFKRIITNCDILFDSAKMTEEELQEVETLSDALINSEYEIRKQYREHVIKQIQ
jgi:hypothetical protein